MSVKTGQAHPLWALHRLADPPGCRVQSSGRQGYWRVFGELEDPIAGPHLRSGWPPASGSAHQRRRSQQGGSSRQAARATCRTPKPPFSGGRCEPLAPVPHAPNGYVRPHRGSARNRTAPPVPSLSRAPGETSQLPAHDSLILGLPAERVYPVDTGNLATPARRMRTDTLTDRRMRADRDPAPASSARSRHLPAWKLISSATVAIS
jgi:hypothetical protein